MKNALQKFMSSTSSSRTSKLIEDTKQLVSEASLGNIPDLSSELRLLGDFPVRHGVVSSIFLGEISGGRRVAVKLFVPMRPTMSQDFLREARVWASVTSHDNVAPLLGIARLRNSLALLSPWMPDGDLHVYLKDNPNPNTFVLVADVARGLAHIHTLGITYGNLRPTTVLVSETGRAVLSSFLFAQGPILVDGVETRFLQWRVPAPEHYLSPPMSYVPRDDLTAKNDIFSFGVLAIEILAGRTRQGKNTRLALKKILQNTSSSQPENSSGLPDNLWLLLNQCLDRDPMMRPSADKLSQQLDEFIGPFNVSHAQKTRGGPPSRALKDISAEIKKTSEHPVAAGGYCDLYLGERLGSEKVALKLVRLFGSTDTDKDTARRRFMSEARIWAELEHPRILEFYGICEYGTLSLFMVSPFLYNGNITDYLNNVNPEANRYKLLVEIAEGLLYLHQRRPPVIHGDLKGANILISDTGNAVLADFGLSRISHEATTTMLQGAGSPRWMSPELVLTGDDDPGPHRTMKSDVYAYGHILLEVLGGCRPFFNLREDLHVIVELIQGRRASRPTGPIPVIWLTDPAWEYCQKCTAINPEERPDMDAVLTDLRQLFSIV